MLKKILRIIGLLLIGLLLALLFLYLIPAKESIPEYTTYAAATPSIQEKAGWYRTEAGEYYQVTFRADDGIQLNFFDAQRANLKSLYFKELNAVQFDSDGNPETVEAAFDSLNDSTTVLDVQSGSTAFRATRQDSLYYRMEQVSYSNDTVHLSATLFNPHDTILGAIVMIHGSGVSDRNNFWYMYQADYLAKQGFLVILPDKRGCGKSGGHWHVASFDDFAGDVVAAIDYLESRYPAGLNKIGVMGLSQGGWISHLVAEKASIDFVVDVVSSGTTPNVQVNYEVKRDIRDAGCPAFLAGPLATIFAKRAKGRRPLWWEKNGEFDPLVYIANTNTPVLKIFGSEDSNLPVESSLANVQGLLQANPALPLTVKVFEGSGHGLMDAETGWIRQDYLDLISQWINKL